MSDPDGRPFSTPHAALRWIDQRGAILKTGLDDTEKELFERALDVLLGEVNKPQVSSETSENKENKVMPDDNEVTVEFPGAACNPDAPILLSTEDYENYAVEKHLSINQATVLRDKLTEEIARAVKWQAAQVRLIPVEQLRKGDRYETKFGTYTVLELSVNKRQLWYNQVQVINSLAGSNFYVLGQPVRLISRKDES